MIYAPSMDERYLEVCFRKGRILAAYLYLPRGSDDRVESTEEVSPGLLLDRDATGRPMGLEILSPAATSLSRINDVLSGLRQPLLEAGEVAPLGVAA